MLRKIDLYIIKLALPAVIKNLFYTVIFFVDTVMLGHFSSAALAGVGISGTVIWGITMIIQGLCMGIAAAISRSYGEKDKKSLFYFSGTAFVFMLFLSVSVLISILLFQNEIIAFLCLKVWF